MKRLAAIFIVILLVAGTVQAQQVQLETRWTNLGEFFEFAALDIQLRNALRQAGVQPSDEASLVVRIEAETREGTEFNGVFTAFADVAVSAEAPSGRPLYEQAVLGVKGIQLSYESAGKKALENVVATIVEDLLPELGLVLTDAGEVSDPVSPVAVRDTREPDIVIIEPAVTRGIAVAKKSPQITVRGRIIDDGAIASATVNDRTVRVGADGSFETMVFLRPGSNDIQVTATDAAGNTATATTSVDHIREGTKESGRYKALVIGIDSYQGDWAPLENAVRDASAVADVLESEYGFEVTRLLDKEATRDAIIQSFESVAASAGPNDQVLVYYAGHGELKEEMRRGFWVPIDATTRSTAHYIPNSYIQDLIRGIRSRHTLLVADACFAGDVFRSGSEMLPYEDSAEYFDKVRFKPSRKAITSGGIEPVLDGGRDGHSIFAYYFLKELKENTRPALDAYRLFDSIRLSIVNNSLQTPQFRPISDTGDEGGQFIFVRSPH